MEITMRESKLALRHSIAAVAITASVLVVPIRVHAQSSAVTHIQSYYQQLMPTIQQAGRLSVRERDSGSRPPFVGFRSSDNDATGSGAGVAEFLASPADCRAGCIRQVHHRGLRKSD
jgi:hypothetical protein